MRNSIRCNRQIFVVAFGFALALVGQTPMAAAADKWLACAGTVTAIEQKVTKTDPSERVLVYNDDLKMLYQWQDKRKALSVIPTLSYTPEQIIWGQPKVIGFSGSYWEGRLNRSDMSLTVERIDSNLDRMTWTEKCVPTQPVNGSDAEVSAATAVRSTSVQ